MSGLAPWSMTTFRSGRRARNRARCGRWRGVTSASNRKPAACMASSAGASSGCRIQASSARSCIIGPQAEQLRVAPPAPRSAGRRVRRLEVGPADHAGHERRGLARSPAGTPVSAAVGAACTSTVRSTPGGVDQRREVVRAEVAADGRMRLRRQPAVVAAADAPEVLVGVDLHQAARALAAGSRPSSGSGCPSSAARRWRRWRRPRACARSRRSAPAPRSGPS